MFDFDHVDSHWVHHLPNFLLSLETGGLGRKAQVVARWGPGRTLGRGTGAFGSNGKLPELSPSGNSRLAWGLLSGKEPQWGLKREDPDHPAVFTTEAECTGVSEEGPSIMAGLGAAQVWGGQPVPSKDLMSPLLPIGLIALFTVTCPKPLL